MGKSVTLLTDVFQQRIEFARRNIGYPDVVLVPLNQQYEFLGELTVRYPGTVLSKDVTVMGMRVVWVDPAGATKPLVCLSSAGLS